MILLEFKFFFLDQRSIIFFYLSLRKCDVARMKSSFKSTWFLKINDRTLQKVNDLEQFKARNTYKTF